MSRTISAMKLREAVAPLLSSNWGNPGCFFCAEGAFHTRSNCKDHFAMFHGKGAKRDKYIRAKLGKAGGMPQEG